MNLLIIDTSTSKPQLVFAKSLEDYQVFVLKRAQDLFDSIKLIADPIEAVAVTIGPGSYTGIRVGYAAALGICMGKNIPLVGVCSLKALVSRKHRTFLSVIDARSGGAYILPQRWEGQTLVSDSSPIKCAIADLPLHLYAAQVIVGPDLEKFSLLNSLETAADPERLIELALSEIKIKQYEPKPVYLDSR